MRASSIIGRVAALVALVVAVLAVVLLLGGGDDYEVTAEFENAGQLVKGNQVVVGGSAVGTVDEIELGDDGQAAGHVQRRRRLRAAAARHGGDGPLALALPDRRPPGSADPPAELGEDADPIEDGGTLSQSETVSAVDLDQLFNTLSPKTINDFKHVIKGMATSYEGVGPQANKGLHYLNPFLSTSRQVFAELNSDQTAFENLIVDTSQLSGALAERAPTSRRWSRT